MTDDPVSLDAYRDAVSKKAASLRRSHQDAADSNKRKQEISDDYLEQGFLDNPARDWPDVAAKAHYLVTRFVTTSDADHPRRTKLILQVLEELSTLSNRTKDV